jgi:Ca-activated chloride channel family protein
MKILNPGAFWLLLLLLPIILQIIISYRYHWQNYIRLGGSTAREPLYLFRYFCLSVTFIGFFVFSVLAYADIYWGKRAVHKENSGLDIVFVLDVSNSMMAADAEPNRMELARAFTQELTYSLTTARKGLVLFKGIAVPMSPLTADATTITNLLRNAGPSLLTAPGSNMAAGITSAVQLFTNDSGRKQIILLVSDGEALSGDLQQAIRLASQKNITIFAVGVGTQEGADLYSSTGEAITDKRGQLVHSRLEEATLISAANLTNGVYFNAADNINNVLNELKDYEQKSYRIDYESRSIFNIFAIIALINLIGRLAIRSAKWQALYGSY